MCFKLAVLALACLSGLEAEPVEFVPRYRYSDKPAPTYYSDLQAAETNNADPHEAIRAGSKYFQDIYVAMEKPNELQFGHVAENPHNWEQRFEKINLGNLQRQGKVRWGDKDGAYGEHYYDYNHDGQNKPQQTRNRPQYASYQQFNPRYGNYRQQVRQESILSPSYTAVDGGQRRKRGEGLLGDVEFISDKAKSLILDGTSQKHGGNYRRADDYRGKREQHRVNEEDFGFASDKERFLDQKTGIEYEPKPVDP